MSKCSYCSKVFKYESERKRHETSHNPATYECIKCQKKFSFVSALRRHEKQHNRSDKVQCLECGGSFKDKELLRRHMNYAHKGLFKCEECQTLFASDLALKNHKKTHNKELDRRYCCSFIGCTKSFNFKHHLQHHELTHTDRKQHFCSYCQKGFIQLHHLKEHLLTHQSQNLYHCYIGNCNKNFITEDAKIKHIAAHYNCILCSSCGELIKNKSFLKHSIECKQSTNIDKNNSIDISFSFKTNKTNSIHPNIEDSLKIINDEKNNKNDENINCKSCSCAKIIRNNSCNNQINNSKNSNVPEIFYKDGAIKIKETFDSDIFVLNKYQLSQNHDNVKSNISQDIPYNSCKAVLGTCIISGDGSINDDCLCAKMAADAQEDEPDFEQIYSN